MNVLLGTIVFMTLFIIAYKITTMILDFIMQGTKLGKQLRKERQIEAISSVFIMASNQYFDMMYRGIILVDYGYLSTVSLKKLIVLLGGNLKEYNKRVEKLKKELGIATSSSIMPTDTEISEIIKKWEKKQKDGNDKESK